MQDPALDRPVSTALTAAIPATTGQAARAPLRHRPEIDGLRAFAILPILLLHCGVTTLRGGYVGVDIFFVISGYLITAIIQAEIAAGTFTLTGFYRRRILRILPALLLMIVVVLGIGCVLLFPIPLRELGQSTAATAVFGSNIYFFATIDYFSGDLKPLVHTWSLAVEEQFYVLYPLLLLALRRLKAAQLITVMIALAVVSLAIGAYQALYTPSAGFYLLPSRVWELLLGGLVALGAVPRLSPALRTLACWLALAAVLLTMMVIKTTWPFPVPFAIPVAGAAAILIAYSPGTSVAALLSWAPLRWIGLLSYSLYLWHRPIIAYYLLGRSIAMDWRDTVILLTLCFGAASASFFLVERPALRRWRTGKGLRPHAMALSALAVVAGLGLAVGANAERLRPLPPHVAQVVGFLGFDHTPVGRAQYGTGHCFALPYEKQNDPECLQPRTGRANILLVGDSHAAQLSQALRRAIAPAHLLQATAAGCRPTLGGRGFGTCEQLVEKALTRTDFRHVTAVVLAGRWFDTDAPLLVGTIKTIQARGVQRVIVVGPVLEFDADVPDLLGRAMLAHDLSRVGKTLLPDRVLIDRDMRQAVTSAGARYVSHFPIECPQDRCLLFTPDGGPRHIDHSHLTPAATLPVAQAIVSQLK